MTIKEFIFLVLNILKDWHVIATAVTMLFIIWFANFIIHYRRKPRKNKKKKSGTVAPVKPAATEDENKPAMSESEAE